MNNYDDHQVGVRKLLTEMSQLASLSESARTVALNRFRILQSHLEQERFLTRVARNTLPRYTPEARKANQALVELLSEIAARKKATHAQIALAWLLRQKPWIVPIPGTRKLERQDENIGASSVELTSYDLGEIDNAASKIPVHAARYSEKLE